MKRKASEVGDAGSGGGGGGSRRDPVVEENTNAAPGERRGGSKSELGGVRSGAGGRKAGGSRREQDRNGSQFDIGGGTGGGGSRREEDTNAARGERGGGSGTRGDLERNSIDPKSELGGVRSGVGGRRSGGFRREQDRNGSPSDNGGGTGGGVHPDRIGKTRHGGLDRSFSDSLIGGYERNSIDPKSELGGLGSGGGGRRSEGSRRGQDRNGYQSDTDPDPIGKTRHGGLDRSVSDSWTGGYQPLSEQMLRLRYNMPETQVGRFSSNSDIGGVHGKPIFKARDRRVSHCKHAREGKGGHKGDAPSGSGKGFVAGQHNLARGSRGKQIIAEPDIGGGPLDDAEINRQKLDSILKKGGLKDYTCASALSPRRYYKDPSCRSCPMKWYTDTSSSPSSSPMDPAKVKRKKRWERFHFFVNLYRSEVANSSYSSRNFAALMTAHDRVPIIVDKRVRKRYKTKSHSLVLNRKFPKKYLPEMVTKTSDRLEKKLIILAAISRRIPFDLKERPPVYVDEEEDEEEGGR